MMSIVNSRKNDSDFDLDQSILSHNYRCKVTKMIYLSIKLNNYERSYEVSDPNLNVAMENLPNTQLGFAINLRISEVA